MSKQEKPAFDEANQARYSLLEHEIEIRVRYQETDAQGHAHHTTYVNWFEIGRIEMLRAAGFNYRDLEANGILLVVTEVGCRYYSPTQYDDLLQLTTRVISAKGTRIRHEYEIRHDEKLVASGFTVIAAVDRTGKVVRLPSWLRLAKNEPDPGEA
jgi:acyl-CoA thioester hydrolase